ncbi:MAG TPA: hypothetical protein VNV62_24845 [Trebonia sp.]|jgi:arabinose-5-phosphate isomerase|nr:hypothetical protein [Trebonia sp.]
MTHDNDMTHIKEKPELVVRECISVWTGVGKSGYAARLLAATAATCGLSARYVHAEDLLHGELSSLRAEDALIAVSWSGRSQSVVEVISRTDAATVLITGPRSGLLPCFPDHLIECEPIADTLLTGVPAESVMETLRVGYSLIARATTAAERRVCLRIGHPHGALGDAIRQADTVKQGA